LTQADPMWVRFALSDTEYAALRAAVDVNPKTVSVDVLQRDGSVRAAGGQLNFAASTIDESLGTVQLRAEFRNKDLAILPGEYVRVRVSGGTREAITVPQQAVLQNAEGPFVWVVNEGKPQQRKVTTASWIDADWEIASGLQPGDLVIVDQLLKLKADKRVEVRTRAASEPQNASRPTATAAQSG
jgi:membrane fusion protein (multidrug efflux system)